jgi:hypothetical protein
MISSHALTRPTPKRRFPQPLAAELPFLETYNPNIPNFTPHREVAAGGYEILRGLVGGRVTLCSRRPTMLSPSICSLARRSSSTSTRAPAQAVAACGFGAT